MTTKIACSILAGFFMLTNPAAAQQSPVDGVITDLYESISFSDTQDPNYKLFKSLFVEDARLISVTDTTSYTLTPDDYEDSMTKQRENGKILAFEEKELHRETDRYGNIMQIFSTYQTHLETPDGTDSARGINSIQLKKENGQWKIVSIIWYDENDAHPLPEKYLPAETGN